MLKSTHGAAGADNNRLDTSETVNILVGTAAALVGFLMVYLVFFDPVIAL